MHASTFDRYEERASPAHRLDPRVKVVLVLLFVLSNVLLPDGAWLAFLASWLLLLAASLLSRLPLSYTVRRSLVALPFVLVAVTSIFSLPGRPVLALPFGLVATDAGLLRFSSIVIRSWLSVQAAILLTATTQFPDMMHALRHLRLPQLIVAIISFMYRYLFVLTDEVMRLRRARDARSAVPEGQRGGGSLWWRARVAGNMAGQLFLRSYERSSRIYDAMVARGYHGHFVTLNPHLLRAGDYWTLLVAFLLLALVQIAGRLV
jgi:cobalt/nickel transport system permease protein